jgi:hypothetical protein
MESRVTFLGICIKKIVCAYVYMCVCVLGCVCMYVRSAVSFSKFVCRCVGVGVHGLMHDKILSHVYIPVQPRYKCVKNSMYIYIYIYTYI